MVTKKTKINKKVTINFISLVNNPEMLLEKNIDWEKLSANEKVVDSLKRTIFGRMQSSYKNRFR